MTPNQNPEPEKIVISTEEPTEAETVAFASAPIVTEKARLRPRVKKSGGMFDVPEIAAVSIAGLLLLAVVFTYYFGVVSAREDLKRRETRRNDMEKQLQDLQAKVGDNRTTEESVSNLVGSVERFETSYLAPASTGNAALYGRLNELIRANNLRNTAGPEYAPLEVVGAEKYNADERGARSKFQSLYPGTLVTMTVEGNYSNLRRFVRELENSRQFIVISSIEIESTGEEMGGGGSQTGSQNNAPVAAPRQQSSGFDVVTGMPVGVQQNPRAPQGGDPNRINPRAPQVLQTPPPTQPAPPPASSSAGRSRGSIVSLRLEMGAYFRPNYQVGAQ